MNSKTRKKMKRLFCCCKEKKDVKLDEESEGRKREMSN
jgi:hypothetical protein